MAYEFGRLIAAGPLAIRGPVNVVPPRVILAVADVPVRFDPGEWYGAGGVVLEARLFSAGAVVSLADGQFVPGRDQIGTEIYVVVTAIDGSGVPVQVASKTVAIGIAPFEGGAFSMAFSSAFDVPRAVEIVPAPV